MSFFINTKNMSLVLLPKPSPMVIIKTSKGAKNSILQIPWILH